jgi:hypothetical protein
MLSRTVSSRLAFGGNLLDRFPGSGSEDARHCVSSVFPLEVEVRDEPNLQGDASYDIECESQSMFFEREEIALLSLPLEQTAKYADLVR